MHKRTGLIVFGVLWILVGLGAGGMSLLMMVGIAANAGTPGAPPMRMMVPVALLYIGIGALFVTLGVGSILARRWARALILVLSWFWLITGVLSLFVLFLILPQMLSTLPAEQAAAKPVIIGCVAVFFALFFILLPGIAILFYRRPSVKETVEALDPVPRWTDQPLPLLAFSVWMMSGAASLLLCAFIYRSFPVGAWLIKGLPMYAMIVLFAAMCAFIAYGALKRMPSAWWAAIAMLVIGVAWGVVLMPKTDIAAWYRDSGLATSPQQIELTRSLYKGPYFIAWMAVVWLVYAGFVLYLRRYFVQNENRMYPPST